MLLTPDRQLHEATLVQGAVVANPPTTGWTETRTYTLACPGLPTQQVEIARSEPTGSLIGTVVFQAGGAGEEWLLTTAGFNPWIARLRAGGWRLIMTRYVSGWFNNSDAAIRPGNVQQAGRVAGTLRYVHGQWAVGGKICFAGSSGGASAIGYVLGFYGLASLFDAVLPVSGPPHADIHSGCTLAGALAYDSDAADKIDVAWSPSETACELNQPAVRGSAWAQDSIIAGYTGWANTRTLYMFGTLDTTMSPAQGEVLRALQPRAYVAYPFEMLHAGLKTVTSQQVAYDFIRGAPFVRQAKLGQNLDNVTTFTVPFHAPVSAGNLLVAVHHVNDVNPTTPTGWAVARQILTAPLALSCYWKVAAGNETGVTVGSAGTGVQRVDVYEVQHPGVTNWQLDAASLTVAVTPGVTQLTLGPSGVPGGTVGFAVGAVGVAPSVVYNQAWTNDWIPQGFSTRMSTAAYAWTTAAALTSVETWNVAADARGLLVAFRPA